MKKIYKVNNSLAERVRYDFPQKMLKIDKELKFYYWFIKEINNKTKSVTIRYAPDAIRIPCADVLPCFATDPSDSSYRQQVPNILSIPYVLVSTIGELTNKESRMDGFCDKAAMIDELSRIYDCRLKAEDIVSIYFLGGFKTEVPKEILTFLSERNNLRLK